MLSSTYNQDFRFYITENRQPLRYIYHLPFFLFTRYYKRVKFSLALPIPFYKVLISYRVTSFFKTVTLKHFVHDQKEFH